MLKLAKSLITLALFSVISCNPSGAIEDEEDDIEIPSLHFNELGHINASNQTSYDLTGTCENGDSEVQYLIGRQQEEGEEAQESFLYEGTVLCINGKWEVIGFDFTDLPEGEEVHIEISNDGPVVKATLIKDTIIPQVTLNTVDPYITSANQKSFELGGSCSEAGEVSFDVGVSQEEVPCTSEDGWMITVDLQEESEGEVPITINFKDIAQNMAMQVLSETIKDSINPTVSLEPSDPINGDNVDRYTIEGECSEDGQTVTVILTDGETTLNPMTAQPTCDSNQHWTASFNAGNLNDGTVNITVNHIDTASNQAMLSQAEIAKDIIAPQPESRDIVVPTNNHYTGGALDFIVGLTEEVIAHTEQGIPRIALDVGGNTRYASYVSGSDSNELVFRYVIQTGDEDRTGITPLNNNSSIDLNSGIITDRAGNRLTNTMLSIPSLTGITIDGTAPTLNSVVATIAQGSDQYYRLGESVTLTATFSKLVTITGTPALRLEVEEVERTASYAGTSGDSGTSHNFTYTVIAGENDADGITVVGINSHSSIVDGENLNVAAEIAPALNIDNVIVDTTAPTVTGLENDTDYKMDKTWTWQCSSGNEVSCRYRFVINSNSIHQFGNEEYGTANTADTQSSLSGRYYLHVQAIDAAGNESSVANASVNLDNRAPTVLSEEIGVPPDRIYSTNEELDFTVKFDEEVWVDTTDGTPRLVLTVGSTTRYANYINGSGTATLHFRYVVQMGDEDNDGILVANGRNIDLNNGTIRDRVNNASTSTNLTVPNLEQVKINSIAPTLERVAVQASSMTDPYYRADEMVTLAATFSEPVTITGSPQLILQVAASSAIASYAGENGASGTIHHFTYTVADNENDADGITVTDLNLHRTIVDSDGNVAIANVAPAIVIANLIVDTTPPTLAIDDLEELTYQNVLAYPVTGTCNEAGEVLVSVLNSSLSKTVSCDGERWNTHFNIAPLPEGDVTFQASLSDIAGNTDNAPNAVIVKGNLYLSFLLQKISSGDEHSCVVTAEGGVKCWGRGEFGQLGDNQNRFREYPVSVQANNSGSGPLMDVIQVDSGTNHSCGLLQTGQVKCWGLGNNGQLGNDSSNDRHFAVSVTNLDNAVQVSTGANHCCALTATGEVKCWGYAALGSGNFLSYSPQSVLLSDGGDHLSDIVQVSSGTNFSCALTTMGQVYCWGLGASNSDYPFSVMDGGDNNTVLSGIVQISAGEYHTCVLTSRGEVKCWGLGYSGQLGHGQSQNSDHPVTTIDGHQSSTPLGDIVQISAGKSHTCALTSTGEVKCWGLGSNGQLGHDSLNNKNYPVSVVHATGNSAALSRIIQVDAGEEHTCALTLEGEVKCWGRGTSGQLGHGKFSSKDYPVNVVANRNSINFLDIGTYGQSYDCLIGNNLCTLRTVKLSLSGATSSPGNNHAVSIAVSGMASGETVTIFRDSTCTSPGGNASSNGDLVDFSGLSEGIHKFYFETTGGHGSSSCSKNFLTYILDTTAPDTPKIELQTLSPARDPTPTVKVSMVSAGDLIQVYRDSACNVDVIGTARAHTGAPFVDITVSALTAGSYHFYASAVDAAGNVSDCSEASLEYVLSEVLH